jgi:hypothetical protein
MLQQFGRVWRWAQLSLPPTDRNAPLLTRFLWCRGKGSAASSDRPIFAQAERSRARKFPPGPEHVPFIRVIIGTPGNHRDTNPGAGVRAEQSIRRHMARNAEPIETDLVELIALDHKSYFAADFRSPLHRQGIKPLDESRHRPVAFPQRTRILRMRKPIEVRSLATVNGALRWRHRRRRRATTPATAKIASTDESSSASLSLCEHALLDHRRDWTLARPLFVMSLRRSPRVHRFANLN